MAKSSSINKLLQNQVFRFVLSAGVGFGVDVSIFRLFNNVILNRPTYTVFNVVVSNYNISFTLSFFAGVTVNFLITRFMVFNESKLAAQKQFFRFLFVAIIGFFANYALFNLFIRSLNFNPTAARVTAALSLFFASFFIHKVFSFSLSLKRNHANSEHHKPGN